MIATDFITFLQRMSNAGALDAVRVDEHDYNRLFYVHMIQRPKRVINININESKVGTQCLKEDPTY